MKNVLKPVARAVMVALAAGGLAGNALAQSPETLKSQIDALQRQIDELRANLDRVKAEQARPSPPKPSTSVAGAVQAFWANTTFYGNLDVSVDYTTKGIAGFIANNGTDRPFGRMGWVPAISTNLSYLGLRGKHAIERELDFIYQLEAQIDISATPGTVNTNSNNDSIVKGALFSRDTFIGLAGKDWGSVKIGKGDAPYKKSTGRLNPFLATVGDYAAIMGNTGGDNRVEFGTRFDHAIWYESPNFSGFSFSALYSPGQNRAQDNSIQAIGESSCAGGNVPGSGALPYGCNDGAFGNAYSIAGQFESGPLYLTAAYEMHKDVNRSSDSDGTVVMVNGVNYTFDQSVGIGNEWAWKVAAQFRLPTSTTVGVAYEDIKRTLPFHYFDERSRKAYWLQVSQQLDPNNVFHFGYGHAKPSPGAAGEHNISSGPGQDNTSNMYTGMYRHNMDKQTSWYAVYATQVNHSAGHYDLGAGGRANTTDCHDASQISAFDLSTGTYVPGGPFCYTGGKLQAVSFGLNYRF
jgi:predicted porin